MEINYEYEEVNLPIKTAKFHSTGGIPCKIEKAYMDTIFLHVGRPEENKISISLQKDDLGDLLNLLQKFYNQLQ